MIAVIVRDVVICIGIFFAGRAYEQSAQTDSRDDQSFDGVRSLDAHRERMKAMKEFKR